MNNIFVLPIAFHSNKTDLIIYPTLLKDDNELILIDCGYPDSMPRIENEMNKIELSLSQLTKSLSHTMITIIWGVTRDKRTVSGGRNSVFKRRSALYYRAA